VDVDFDGVDADRQGGAHPLDGVLRRQTAGAAVALELDGCRGLGRLPRLFARGEGQSDTE
jgi:hypothetical protein